MFFTFQLPLEYLGSQSLSFSFRINSTFCVFSGAYVDLKERVADIKQNPTSGTMSLTSDAVFAGIGDRVKAEPAKAKSVNAVFVYKITDGGKVAKEWSKSRLGKPHPSNCINHFSIDFSSRLEEWKSLWGRTPRCQSWHNHHSVRCRHGRPGSRKTEPTTGLHEGKAEDYRKYYAHTEVGAPPKDRSQTVITFPKIVLLFYTFNSFLWALMGRFRVFVRTIWRQ